MKVNGQTLGCSQESFPIKSVAPAIRRYICSPPHTRYTPNHHIPGQTSNEVYFNNTQLKWGKKKKKISEDNGRKGKEIIKANYQNYQKVDSIPSPSCLLLLIDLAFHYFLFELL